MVGCFCSRKVRPDFRKANFMGLLIGLGKSVMLRCALHDGMFPNTYPHLTITQTPKIRFTQLRTSP